MPLTRQPPTATALYSPAAQIRLLGHHLNGKNITGQSGEVRLAIHQFLVLLHQSGHFSFVTTQPQDIDSSKPVVELDIAINDDVDTHMASQAAKGCVTGFFTLGLFGYVLPGEYEYKTTMTVTARYPTEPAREFVAEAHGTAEPDLNKPGDYAKAAASLRGELLSAVVTEIASKICSGKE